MKKIFQFITAIAIGSPVAISATTEPSSEASLLTEATISEAIKAMPANAAVDQPLHTIDEGIANVGIFIVHRPQEPDQGCTIEHDTLVNDRTTSICPHSCACCSTFVFSLDGSSVGIASQRQPQGKASQRV